MKEGREVGHAKIARPDLKGWIAAFLFLSLIFGVTNELLAGGFKVSMAIQVVDKDGARAKQGDIIAIKPAGWQWGTKEYEQFLIIEVDLGNYITTWEDAQKLTVPQFETGELWYPSDDLPQPKVIGKRRYKIPFTDLDVKAKEKGIDLDFSKITDQHKATNYQPLEKTTLSFDDLIQDKVLKKKLGKAELKIIKDIGK